MGESSILVEAETINIRASFKRDEIDYHRAQMNHQLDIDLAKVYELRLANLTALLSRCNAQEREAIEKMLGVIRA
jgi:hypothetical protein